MRRLRLEALEDRRLLTIFYDVALTADGVPGSLRDAINAANSDLDDSVINLAAGTFTLTLPGSGEDDNASGDLDIVSDGSLTINGAGRDVTIIDASGLSDRAFHILDSAVANFSGVKITGGDVDGDGGGIFNELGTATIFDSEIAGNMASGSGGGVASTAGFSDDGSASLSIADSTISGNVSDGLGGGVANYRGELEILDSTISNNTASYGAGVGNLSSQNATISGSTISENDAAGGSVGGDVPGIVAGSFGGGVANISFGENAAGLMIVNSTVSGNDAFRGSDFAGGNGGGVANVTIYGGSSHLSLANSTVSGNRALGDAGGGVLNFGNTSLRLSNSTISGNTATSTGGGVYSNTNADNNYYYYYYYYGPGPCPDDDYYCFPTSDAGEGEHEDGHVTISNSTISLNAATSGEGGGIFSASEIQELLSNIIAHNAGSDGVPDDLFDVGGIGSASFNLIESPNGHTIPDGGPAMNIVGVDPLLLPLQDNGGPTKTHALPPQSPAIDTGSNPDALATDQRGEARTIDTPADNADDGTDIGAFELQVLDLAVAIGENDDPVVAGSGANNLVYTVDVVNNGPSDASNLTYDLSNSPLPAGVSFVSAVGDGANDLDGVGVDTWSIGALASGSMATLTVTYTVDATTADGATVTLTADNPQLDETLIAPTGDDTASETTTVQRKVDVAVSIDDDPDPVVAGSGANNLVYTVTVANNGPSAASGLTYDLSNGALPAGVSFVSAVGDGANDLDGVGVDTWSIGALASGSMATLTVTYTVDATAADGAMVTLTADNPQLNEMLIPPTSDDTASETATVQRRSDLSIIKSDGADPVIAGSDLIYTLEVTNKGPSDAANVVVADTLPAGVSFLATSGCAEDPGGAPTCNLGTIAAGDSASYDILVNVDGATRGVITNSAQVMSDSIEDAPGDESISEDTEVLSGDDEACLTGGPLQIGQNRLIYSCATPGSLNAFVSGSKPGASVLVPDYGTTVDLADPHVEALGIANHMGIAVVFVEITAEDIAALPPGGQFFFQAIEMKPNPEKSNIISLGPPNGKLDASSIGPGAAALHADQLSALIDVALSHWEAVGLSSAERRLLAGAEVAVTDLDGAALGVVDGNRIFLDRDAAGNGWFVDPDPYGNEGFVSSNHPGETIATLSGATQIDALTVLMHEMGHLLGLPDVATPGHLMNRELPIGARRMPVSNTNWQLPADVDRDGEVTVFDAFMIVGALREQFAAHGPSGIWLGSDALVDTDGDFRLTTFDIMIVVGALQRIHAGLGEGESGGQPSPTQDVAPSGDANPPEPPLLAARFESAGPGVGERTSAPSAVPTARAAPPPLLAPRKTDHQPQGRLASSSDLEQEPQEMEQVLDVLAEDVLGRWE